MIEHLHPDPMRIMSRGGPSNNENDNDNSHNDTNTSNNENHINNNHINTTTTNDHIDDRAFAPRSHEDNVRRRPIRIPEGIFQGTVFTFL